MQSVSETYASLFRAGANQEPSAVINGVRYTKDSIWSLKTQVDIFSNQPTIGCCISGEIDISLLNPTATIPKMASIKPYVRLKDGTQTSEWVQKGKYFIDTRQTTANDDGLNILSIHGYDAMLKAESDYPDDGASYPRAATAVVATIASAMGVSVDSRTNQYLSGITVPTLPVGYSCREVLSNIAVLACGNWVMSDIGELRFLPLNDLPEETNLLVTEHGDIITFGGVGIVIG